MHNHMMMTIQRKCNIMCCKLSYVNLNEKLYIYFYFLNYCINLSLVRQLQVVIILIY